MKKNTLLIRKSPSKIFLCLTSILFISCEEKTIVEQVQEQKQQFPINDLIQQKSYWEGSINEYEETFILDEEENIKLKENDSSFSGYIKIRARNGTITAMKSYSGGFPDGDFYEWYESGRLKIKSQYKMGDKHGYFYIWTKNGDVYSQRYFQNDLEDFGRFDNEGASASGKSLASLELEEWEGTGSDFYGKFAGDPKRGGTLYIRETEELYTGVITAFDDNGKKEAVLRFLNGKYEGRISKWNQDGDLWHEAEYSRGELVQITLKNGKPFNPNEIIDLSENPEQVSLLFDE